MLTLLNSFLPELVQTVPPAVQLVVGRHPLGCLLVRPSFWNLIVLESFSNGGGGIISDPPAPNVGVSGNPPKGGILGVSVGVFLLPSCHRLSVDWG